LEALTLLTNKKGISRIDENGKLSCGKVPLVEFSTWLSEYDCCLHDVEIPGCYFFDLNKEPSVHDHPKIVSCVPELLVMASKRKPKRITFVGSNGKEYAFLCKGGEDLRNDERILSMFELMNVIVNRHVDVKTHADAYAIKSNVELHVKTYTVIPMTVTLGLLEWVHNSIPLKTAIETEMLFDKDFCQNNKEAIGHCNNKQVVDFNLLAAAQLQTKWLTSHSADSYHSMFKSKSLKAAITVFKLMQDQVPRDLLRRVLLKVSI
jgi:DNA-dependent protein kinase catalytic subunit